MTASGRPFDAALADLALGALSGQDLSTTADRVVRLAVEVTGAQVAALLEEGRRAAVVASTAGDGLPPEPGHEVPCDTQEPPRLMLVVWGTRPTGAQGQQLAQLARVVGAAADRERADEQLRESQQRLAEAQQIAHLGSYDWHIPTDTNRWSDELYRIYGTEPGSFNASYERFLSFVHPEDREHVQAVHRRALEERSAYETTERIVRPDGEVRTLRTTGRVVTDERGEPVRVVGVCVDVTEHDRAAREARRQGERFAAIVRSAPDALLVVDHDGTIVQVNPRVTEVFGYGEDELIGQPIERLIPDAVRARHVEHREAFQHRPRSRPMAAGQDLFGRRKDGTEVPVDISLAPARTDDAVVTIAFVRDATERRRAQQLALRLHDAQTWRRQALEINDNVVQGLTSVTYALESGEDTAALGAVRRTLAAARAMMNDLLDRGEVGQLSGAELRRATAPSPVLVDELQVPPGAGTGGPVPALVVDDSRDLRLLLRLALDRAGQFEVVAEAADGREALELAQAHDPRLVLLDLAMPVMDGFEALPRLRELLPTATIVVLSGFDAQHGRERALAHGADAYVEKGIPLAELAALLEALVPTAGGAGHPAGPPDPERPAGPAEHLGLQELGHELRTPLTVIRGILETLELQYDRLPSAAASELLAAATRNADQMQALLDSVSLLQRLETGTLELVREPVDLVRFAREVVSDLGQLGAGRSLTVTAEAEVVTSVDRVRVRQVLSNLLSNAFKFSPAGAPVRVHVARAGQHAVVAVEDEGPGVPPEREAELFGAFQRLGSDEAGTGLGLHLSRAVARAHGGELRYERRPEGGSRFVLELPLAAGTAADRATASPSSQA